MGEPGLDQAAQAPRGLAYVGGRHAEVGNGAHAPAVDGSELDTLLGGEGDEIKPTHGRYLEHHDVRLHLCRVAAQPVDIRQRLGQHTREVLADWLDNDATRVDELIKSGAIGGLVV